MDDEVKCCRFCGRDTTDRSGICDACTGDAPVPEAATAGHQVLEDDYGEESDANSVCAAATLVW